MREASQSLVNFRKPQEKILSLGTTKPSFAFYTQSKIYLLNTRGRIESFIQENDINNYPVDSVIVVTREKSIKRLQLQPEDYTILSQHGVYYVIRIDKEIFWNVEFAE